MTIKEKPKLKRCAIYTRKSHEDGLEQEFNSLDAQREAGESYIASQKSNGWLCLTDRYDDGGVSGGTLERPALKRLLTDCENGKIDVIVVYKIDRLSRSLTDFAELSAKLDRLGVSFVSVTQEINTSTSSGRMMLNILMTFAQYEREVITERIRDKVAAAKKRGKHCGGYPVLGYDTDPVNKRLVVNENEAESVRFIFEAYAQSGSAKQVAKILADRGIVNKQWTTRKGKSTGGSAINSATVYHILNNPLYIGKIRHHALIYDGEQPAIVPRKLWDTAHEILNANHAAGDNHRKTPAFNPLRGLLRCGCCNSAMSLTYTRKGDRKYPYYICIADSKRAISTCKIKRIPAAEMERVLLHQLGAIFRTPSCVAMVGRAYENLPDKPDGDLEPKEIHEAMSRLELIWDVLYPTERQKLLAAILEHATVYDDCVELEIKTDGIRTFADELRIINGENKQ
jgi:site-specific DNA recombinase